VGQDLHAFVERILARLEDAELHEVDPWLRDDIRIAWITVLRAGRREKFPHVTATYAVLGLHPNKVWPAIIEHRKLLLGAPYENFHGVSSPPKKPVRSVELPRRDRAA
jgi:hypothetical protein